MSCIFIHSSFFGTRQTAYPNKIIIIQIIVNRFRENALPAVRHNIIGTAVNVVIYYILTKINDLKIGRFTTTVLQPVIKILKF